MDDDGDSSIIDFKEVGTALSQKAIERLLAHGESVVRNRIAAAKNATRKSYSMYLSRKLRWASYIRNIISDQESIYLPRIYTDSLLMNGATNIMETDVLEFLWTDSKRKHANYLAKLGLAARHEAPEKVRETEAIIVRGGAGAGKTFFMRSAFLKLAVMQSDRIPLLIELRELNHVKLAGLPTVIQREFDSFGADITMEQVLDGLASGLYIVLLDAFDEITHVAQGHYKEELISLARKYQRCPMMLSARPADNMIDWFQFATLDMAPLDESRCIELVMKQPMDLGTRDEFVSLVRTRLFDSHREYLKVPLLAIIMLLTYSTVGTVSDRRHEFFEDAFDALWDRHDAKKGLRRRKHSTLEKSRFRKLLCAFCVTSYKAQRFEFSDKTTEEFLELANRLTGESLSSEAFKADMKTSLSLIVQDGNVLRFCHRSFQEYFAACYLMETVTKNFARVADALGERYDEDSVLHLAYSIDRQKLEYLWVLPKLRKILPRLKRPMSLSEYREFVGNLYLEQLRALYGWSPDTWSLRAYLDAEIDQGGERSQRMLLPEDRSPAGRDLTNLLTLATRLEASQHDQDGAFDRFLRDL